MSPVRGDGTGVASGPELPYREQVYQGMHGDFCELGPGAVPSVVVARPDPEGAHLGADGCVSLSSAEPVGRCRAGFQDDLVVPRLRHRLPPCNQCTGGLPCGRAEGHLHVGDDPVRLRHRRRSWSGRGRNNRRGRGRNNRRRCGLWGWTGHDLDYHMFGLFEQAVMASKVRPHPYLVAHPLGKPGQPPGSGAGVWILVIGIAVYMFLVAIGDHILRGGLTRRRPAYVQRSGLHADRSEVSHSVVVIAVSFGEAERRAPGSISVTVARSHSVGIMTAGEFQRVGTIGVKHIGVKLIIAI